jgi:hypothetical protein
MTSLRPRSLTNAAADPIPLAQEFGRLGRTAPDIVHGTDRGGGRRSTLKMGIESETQLTSIVLECSNKGLFSFPIAPRRTDPVYFRYPLKREVDHGWTKRETKGWKLTVYTGGRFEVENDPFGLTLNRP